MTEGRLFVISGPSGVGKDTVVKELLKEMPNAFLSVSLTTRPPRPGEREGVDYYYTTEEHFNREVAKGRMLESCRYVSVQYGTPKPPVDKAIAEGRPVFLVIEREGMMRVREKCPDAVTVFIMPPSFEQLKERLIGRKTDSPEAIEKRLEKAKSEIDGSGDYQYIVVNDDLDTCVQEIKQIIKKYIND